MTVSPVRVVVADDERPARTFLTSLLRLMPDVDIVGEATNGAEAVQLVEQHRPDVALLDLQMPEVDGISVVRLLRRRYLPLVVFVTAYDEYTVKAFELNAVDYLTKPVSEVRLRETLRRVRERLKRDDLRKPRQRTCERPCAPTTPGGPSRGSIVFRSGGRTTSCCCLCRTWLRSSLMVNCCISRR